MLSKGATFDDDKEAQVTPPETFNKTKQSSQANEAKAASSTYARFSPTTRLTAASTAGDRGAGWQTHVAGGGSAPERNNAVKTNGGTTRTAAS